MLFIVIMILPTLVVSCTQKTAQDIHVEEGNLTWNKDVLFKLDSYGKNTRFQAEEHDSKLAVNIVPESTNDTVITLSPFVGDSIYLPIGEGKLFSLKDSLWISHLSGDKYSAISALSMPFMSIVKNNKAYTMVFENPCRTSIHFYGDSILRMDIKLEFVNLDSKRGNNISVFVTDNNPVSIASVYKEHVQGKRKINTLVEQSVTNPNIRKLFGAPHFYLWDKSERAGQIIEEMYSGGITKAWIGFDNWEETSESRKLVELMNKKGYLIGTYDSYHSIHKPGNEEWSTASFCDSTLYYNCTIKDKEGKHTAGFKGVGRYLNPLYSMGEVRNRTHNILKTGIPFNSWFIDCDATGDVHDDYTPGHESSKQQNLEARINRMTYIRDSLNMVIGSEDGNDFSCSVIAFAHGVELPVFTWCDQDMNKNRESMFFVGTYYTPIEGEVPSRFAKQVPIKNRFYDLFLNPVYTVPLFKLVYNDVMVTANHWEWSSLKIKGAAEERMLHEISFNAAPLYHLSMNEWKRNGKAIIEHTKVWSRIHATAIQCPMTDFRILTLDRKVQQTAFGEKVRITTNYGKRDFTYKGNRIPPMSAWIELYGEGFIYTPKYLK